jgi:hypothetical protein
MASRRVESRMDSCFMRAGKSHWVGMLSVLEEQCTRVLVGGGRLLRKGSLPSCPLICCLSV